MADYFSQTFAASEVALVAGTKPATLQNWLKRPIIIGHGDAIEGGDVQGKHRVFSIYALNQIAVATALVDIGLGAKDAASYAARYAHTSLGKSRLPSLPYHFSEGRTILGCGNAEICLVKHNGKNDIYTEIWANLKTANFCVVNVTEIFEKICEYRDLDRTEVLNAAYGKTSG